MEEILTVSELTLSIKKYLEGKFPFISVQGEISNFKEQASGHLYFTLKDADAQISSVLFRGNAKGLARLPKSGDQVIIKGEMSVYAPRGNYQLIVRDLQFAGIGALLQKWHELKLKLHSLGWFASEIKKPLPKHPKVIGVVTSPTGAVIQDILNILRRRSAGFKLLLNPVKVQGEGAAQEIARAIEQFNTYNLADVLIVGRGGGSLEDLAPFNEECIAVAIHRSRIPVISAVGHETDYCIADYVADLRAPTPSAAAEIVSEAQSRLSHSLKSCGKQLESLLRAKIHHHRVKLAGYKAQPVLSSPYAILGKSYQRLDDYRSSLTTAVRYQLRQKQAAYTSIQRQAHRYQPAGQIALLRGKLNQLTAHLRAIDPKNLIRKGYCILFAENSDSVILSAREVGIGEKVRVLMGDGQLTTKVEEVQ